MAVSARKLPEVTGSEHEVVFSCDAGEKRTKLVEAREGYSNSRRGCGETTYSLGVVQAVALLPSFCKPTLTADSLVRSQQRIQPQQMIKKRIEKKSRQTIDRTT